jgi:hypothetical protein
MGLDGDLFTDMGLNYTRIGKNKERPPMKELRILSKPSVLCPFNESYATLDRCKKCSSYGGVTDNSAKIKCKWPY